MPTRLASMRRFRILSVATAVVLLANAQAQPACAAIDARLTGKWLTKRVLNKHYSWNLCSIAADGKVQFKDLSNSEKRTVVMESKGNQLKSAADSDQAASLFAFASKDAVLILPQSDEADLMIRIPDDRWAALQALKPGESFPERTDKRFNLLDDENAMKPILCNVDQKMVGCWAVLGPHHERSLLQIQKNGDCINQILGPFSEAVSGSIIRSGANLTFIGHGDDMHLNYVFASPDQMILTDPADAKLAEIAIRISEERFTALQKNKSPEASPEFKTLETKSKVLKP